MAVEENNRLENEGKLQTRPPVVVVLGHVDHGKTTLLDKIRQTNIVASEAGGITQHIGAYQIEHKGKKITFIDTPGHAAFSQMRSRGAKVADLAVLVVAADEGVKPQTLESIKHIQTADIPYLIAITKIDLLSTNIDRVKKDLSEHGILIEEYGGDIVVVPVSGKTGEGISDLLDMILLIAEMSELKGSPENTFKGIIIESRLDSQKGPLATVLVRDGSLRVGDEVTTDEKISKIKAMFDENGRRIFLAEPSVPVEVLGFKEVPEIGVRVRKVAKRSTFGSKKKAFSDEKKEVVEPKRKPEKDTEKRRLKIVLKADVAGTLEAITNSLPEEVEIIHSGSGEISESDVLLASATGAEIIGFAVKASGAVKKLAETEGVKIKIYSVIYELLEEIEKRVLKILEPTIDEEVLGKAEIVAEFKIRGERIAGCRIREGQITKTALLHLQRGGKILGDCRIKSMKRGKEDIDQAKKGEECGVVLTPALDFNIGDVLVSYRKVEES